MTTPNEELRARLRIIATDYESGSILRKTIEDVIATLARQEEGREAVAWIDERDLAELQDGKQAKTVVFPNRLDERDLPLYLQPPATVSADAVREISARLLGKTSSLHRMFCDELEALTRGEGK